MQRIMGFYCPLIQVEDDRLARDRTLTGCSVSRVGCTPYETKSNCEQGHGSTLRTGIGAAEHGTNNRLLTVVSSISPNRPFSVRQLRCQTAFANFFSARALIKEARAQLFPTLTASPAVRRS